MRDHRGFSFLALLLVLAIVALTAWLVITRFAQDGAGMLADAGAPLDETKRQRTLADMQAVGRAIGVMTADTGAAPSSLEELEKGGYLARVPTADGWGNPFSYSARARGFTLTSLGSDGRPGPVPPEPWTEGSYVCDLVMTNGQLTQSPAGR